MVFVVAVVLVALALGVAAGKKRTEMESKSKRSHKQEGDLIPALSSSPPLCLVADHNILTTIENDVARRSPPLRLSTLINVI